MSHQWSVLVTVHLDPTGPQSPDGIGRRTGMAECDSVDALEETR